MVSSTVLKRLYRVLNSLVDSSTGIIRCVEEVPRDAGEPDFFHFWAIACDVSAFSTLKNFAKGGGAAVDRGTALAKAVGEAIERYCSALFRIEEFPLTSYRDARFPCVRPEDFTLNSTAQYDLPGFPWVPFNSDTSVRWVSASEGKTRRERYVPAVFVYVPYYFFQGSGDSPIAQSISTGLACHCSYAEAAISAICEVIERDAFTITWQARISRPRIALESLSLSNQDIVRRFQVAGYSVSLVNLTMDNGVPTVLAVLRGSSPKVPPLVTAAATALDAEVATQKSLEELDHTRTYCQRILHNVPRLAPDPTYDNVITQKDHLNFWCDWSHQSHADFLTASDKVIDFHELPSLQTDCRLRDVDILTENVLAVGHQVLLRDLTTPDVRDLGLSVVRAVIPGFHPLVVGHRFRALGGYRLWEIPQRMGYRGIDRNAGDNPYPHPYP